MSKTLPSIERILEAAQQVFGESGHHAATIERIAKLAGVSQQLVHHYFDGKDELYQLVIAASHRSSLEEISRLDEQGGDPVERMRSIFLRFLEYLQNHPDAALLAVDQVMHRATRPITGTDQLWKDSTATIDAVLRDGQQSGVFDPSLTAGEVYLKITALTLGCQMLPWLFPAMEDATSIIENGDWNERLARFFLRGLMPTT